MQSNVLDYEPELALFVPEDNPLLFYDKIIQFAETNLNENGVLYFEINPIFVEELISLLKQSFESIEVRNDFLSRPRMIRASKSKTKT
jgi:release factor glutamine methyltransferase